MASLAVVWDTVMVCEGLSDVSLSLFALLPARLVQYTHTNNPVSATPYPHSTPPQLFWGGGTVALATSNDNFHVLKCRPADKLEDGTVNFLDIIALKHGFAMFDRLGGITAIQSHVASLTEYLYGQLSALKHSNGRPMLEIFGKHDEPESRKVQGGILNFELLKPNGGIHSYRTFEKEAAEAGFHVRTGAACNPGACYAELGVQVRARGWWFWGCVGWGWGAQGGVFGTPRACR
jgi:hypothetical protein